MMQMKINGRHLRVKKMIRILQDGFQFGFPEIMPGFYDEPNLIQYGWNSKERRKIKNELVLGSGSSFSTPLEALEKCLGETIERICLFSFDQSLGKKINMMNWGKTSFPIFRFYPKLTEKKTIIGIEGIDISGMISCPIPAELVYLNYQRETDGPSIYFPRTSSGTGAHFNKEKALLASIYELIERDSFMNVYLGLIPIPKVDLLRLKNKKIDCILEKFTKYGLEVQVFDSTTDIGIPSFIAILLDVSGIGPPLSIGLRAGFIAEEAILDCIKESLASRLTLRKIQSDDSNEPMLPDLGKGMLERAKYWLNNSNISKLNFLTNQSVSKVEYKKFHKSKKKELEMVIRRIGEHGFKIYAVDIAVKDFKKIGYQVFKTVIPGLQPLYIEESERVMYDRKRLLEVQAQFNCFNPVSLVPHPFL